MGCLGEIGLHCLDHSGILISRTVYPEKPWKLYSGLGKDAIGGISLLNTKRRKGAVSLLTAPLNKKHNDALNLAIHSGLKPH
jgi:hypothetical protein